MSQTVIPPQTHAIGVSGHLVQTEQKCHTSPLSLHSFDHFENSVAQTDQQEVDGVSSTERQNWVDCFMCCHKLPSQQGNTRRIRLHSKTFQMYEIFRTAMIRVQTKDACILLLPCSHCMFLLSHLLVLFGPRT